jgi:hypothetical protein
MFKSNGQPPQRSIARIANMNLGAGLCSGVWDRGRLVGFLFINGNFSEDELAVDNTAALLNFIFSYMSQFVAEARVSDIYYRLAEHNPIEHFGHRINSMKLADIIRRTIFDVSGQEADVTVRHSNKKNDYLISHGNVGQIIGRTLCVLDDSAFANIEVIEGPTVIKLEVSTSSSKGKTLAPYQKLALQDIEADAQALGLELHCKSATDFSLEVLADLASSNASVDYSVEEVIN